MLNRVSVKPGLLQADPILTPFWPHFSFALRLRSSAALLARHSFTRRLDPISLEVLSLKNNSPHMQQEMDSVLNEITRRLVPLGIDKLILFGSYASGTSTEDSDIDLLVVDSSETMPADFSEKHQFYRRVADAIRDIKRQIPIDLVVHTRAMHRKFIEMNSAFCREIMSMGKVLYEKHDR